MKTNPHNPPQSSKIEYSYFQIQSIWGVTKHFGGLRVTDELARLCRIGRNATILEVGCGTGFTACHLGEKYGCRVLGVDRSERMVAWARQRAARKGLSGRCQFQVADAQHLPFDEGEFDAMLCESVTAFVPDKHKALAEYCRVVKPGGWVGLNEGTWVKESPPDDFLSFIQRAMGGVKFLPPEGWRALLEDAGLREIAVQVQRINPIQQRRDELQGMDAQDWLQRFRAVGSAFGLYLRDARFREYVKTLIPSRKVMGDLFTYLGYGLYAGKV